MVSVTPVIITALPVPLPFAIVRVVPDCGVKAVDAAFTDTIVPPVAGLFMSGLVVGKLVSLAIGTKPPTSSTSSMTLKSIAPVVATKASELVQVLPLEIVSVESCLKYLASDSVSVKYLLSSVPVAISASVIALACTCSVLIALSAIFVSSTMSAARCSLSIEPST